MRPANYTRQVSYVSYASRQVFLNSTGFNVLSQLLCFIIFLHALSNFIYHYFHVRIMKIKKQILKKNVFLWVFFSWFPWFVPVVAYMSLLIKYKTITKVMFCTGKFDENYWLELFMDYLYYFGRYIFHWALCSEVYRVGHCCKKSHIL